MDEFPPRPNLFQAAERQRRQRGRNLAMLVVLATLAVLFFGISIVKLSHS